MELLVADQPRTDLKLPKYYSPKLYLKKCILIHLYNLYKVRGVASNKIAATPLILQTASMLTHVSAYKLHTPIKNKQLECRSWLQEVKEGFSSCLNRIMHSMIHNSDLRDTQEYIQKKGVG